MSPSPSPPPGRISYASTIYGSPAGPSRTNSSDAVNIPETSLPSFWTSSSHYSDNVLSSSQRQGLFEGIFEGWRHVVLGSYLNFLLIFVPISWSLSFAVVDSHGLRFTFCILALIPLVKLHDISTHELALRIGGSRTGLINASLSNTVAVVVAITALRKCELSVVQSSCSMLSKLLLVLGLCFFAGGMRFSEQVWNPTATQVHASLLSISVGALLLPAAYHFSLSGGLAPVPTTQVHSILNMSHGVALVLLCIYAAYLLFQLWSHPHLYDDRHNKTSTRFSSKISKNLPVNSSMEHLVLPCAPYLHHPSSRFSASQLTLVPQTTEREPPSCHETTVRLVGATCFNRGRSSSAATRVGTDDLLKAEQQDASSSGLNIPITNKQTSEPAPRVSWVFAALVLVVVTVAASVTADELVESMDRISQTIGKEWCALILLPAVTSIAECMTAVNVSVKDRLTFSISVALGSTVQTALFVIPFIVTLGWMMQKPLSLLMDPFQSMVLYISVQTVGYVVADGKSNWLEGLILICLYIAIAVSFWYYPGIETTLGHCVIS